MVMLSMMLVMTVQVTGGCDGDDDFKKKIIITCGPTSGSVSGRPLRKLPLPPMQGGLDTKKTPPTGGLAVKRTQQTTLCRPHSQGGRQVVPCGKGRGLGPSGPGSRCLPLDMVARPPTKYHCKFKPELETGWPVCILFQV